MLNKHENIDFYKYSKTSQGDIFKRKYLLFQNVFSFIFFSRPSGISQVLENYEIFRFIQKTNFLNIELYIITRCNTTVQMDKLGKVSAINVLLNKKNNYCIYKIAS